MILSRVALLAVGGSAAGALLSTESPVQSLKSSYQVVVRCTRDVVAAVATATDYHVSLRGLAGEERAARLAECHARGAQRLLDVCFANGGVYIKAAQHLGQLDHMLPAQYVKLFREHALDRCPISSFSDVSRIFEHDLGQLPSQLFKRFEPTPFASASLAQVHEAELHSGERVAVKVQHAGLLENSAVDILTIRALVWALKTAYPEYDYTWLLDEVESNLPKELDFELESANARRCKANFADRSRYRQSVYVPEVHTQLSSKRILTLEFVSGVKVTDVQGIRRLGFSPHAVAKLVSEAFNEMIFSFGDVHCDPHEANLMVRQSGEGRLQLVLLDHGLYRQIDDNLRREYAGLWKSIVLADVAGIRQHCDSLNAGDMYALFASMLTSRPWEQVAANHGVNRLRIPRTEEDRQLIEGYAVQYNKEISGLLLRIPRELLLLLKTNDCLRAIDLCLGESVNTFVITARECTRALVRLRNDTTMLGRLWTAWDVAMVEFRILAVQLAAWFGASSAA